MKLMPIMGTKLNLLFIILTKIFITNCSVIVFDSHYYRAGHFAFTSNGDMIIEYSKDNFRLFYGLKTNGKYYFKDSSGNEVPSKEIALEYGSDPVQRYESKNIFVSIGSKEYLFSIASSTSVAELLDLNEGNEISYKINLPTNLLGNDIYSYVFSLLKIDEDPQKYLISYINSKFYRLQKFYFTNFGLESTDFTVSTPKVHMK